jgi:hypothetical protein
MVGLQLEEGWPGAARSWPQITKRLPPIATSFLLSTSQSYYHLPTQAGTAPRLCPLLQPTTQPSSGAPHPLISRCLSQSSMKCALFGSRPFSTGEPAAASPQPGELPVGIWARSMASIR